MPDIHPLAKLFQPLEGEAFDALVADIKANGLRQPITLNGKTTVILDGQNRYRACLAAGVEPFYDHYDGDDPLGFVLSMNVARRHLDSSQRATIAAKLANLPHGVRSDRAAELPVLPITQAAAAKMLGVSERLVRDARAVLDHAAPDAVRAVEVGEIPVSRAVESVRHPQPELVPFTDEDSKRVAAAGEAKELKESDRYREKRDAADKAVLDGALAWLDKASTDRRLSFVRALMDKLADAERWRVIEAVTGAKVSNRDDPDGPIYEYPQ